MLGIIGVGQNQTETDWDDQGYKFFFSSSTDYDLREKGNKVNNSSGSYEAGDRFSLTVDRTGQLVMRQGATELYRTTLSDTSFHLVISAKNTAELSIGSVAFGPQADMIATCEPIDTDGDGTPNRLDLDSDGDGCSDALEAGATSSTTTDYQFTSSVGSNGLADIVEDSDTITYLSTHDPYALSKNLATCLDTDGDGVNDLIDLDDDNDGILDHLESPDCFLKREEVDMVKVTTGLTNYSNNSSYQFSELFDGVEDDIASYGSDNTPIKEETVYEFVFAQALPVDTFEVVSNYSIFSNGATFKIQGYDGASWVDLSDTLSGIENRKTNYHVVTKNRGDYKRYRFYGVSGTTYSNQVYEINPIAPVDYIASAYPKDSCSADADGDGVYNHQDLDSDDDGCSDAREAGATLDKTNGFSFNGNVGVNGVYDSLELSADTGLLKYEADLRGAYSLAYGCQDFDGDGIIDPLDLDDDNDGVPDDQEGDECVELQGDQDIVVPAGVTAVEVTLVGGNGGDGGSDVGGPGGSGASGEALRGVIPVVPGSTLKFRIGTDGADGEDGSGSMPIIEAQAGQNAFGGKYNGGSGGSPGLTGYSGAGAAGGAATVLRVPQPDGSFKDYVAAGGGGGGGAGISNNGVSSDCNQTGDPKGANKGNPDGAGAGGGGGGAMTGLGGITFSGDVGGGAGCSGQSDFPGATVLSGEQVSTICLGGTDTDGDGILNRFDLDSDGDGCSDALEAGATSSTTTGYQFSSPVGSNGLPDAVETTTDSDTINYQSTYDPYALSDNLAACVDTDGDGINDLVDIDDDNDGVLDHEESPDCFLSPSEVDMIEVTTSLTNYSTDPDRSFEELYDGVDDDFAAYGSNGTPITNETVYEFIFAQPVPLKAFEVTHQYSIFKSGATFKFAQPVPLKAFEVTHNYSIFENSATFKIQGYDGSTWVDLSGTITGVQNTNSTNTFDITQNQGNYIRYRFYGLSGQTYDNRMYEIDPIVADGYNPSLYPKASCANDTDGDGVYNHQDLDSDADGCSDGVEGATQLLSENDVSNYPSGSDTSGNGLLDTYDIALTGSYYNAYALQDSIDACADADGDDLVDVVDIDDDNDGVPDATEQTENCDYLGGINDFRKVSFDNAGSVNIDPLARDSIAVNKISGTWVTTYSNKTYERPVRLEFKVDDVNSNSMIGLIGTSQNKTNGNWNDDSHKFYFDSDSDYDVRYFGNDGPQISYTAGDEFVISIDETGSLSMRQNGVVVHTDQVTDTEFQFAVSEDLLRYLFRRQRR
jgi:hypothetical protein